MSSEFQALVSRNRSDRVHELLASNRHDGSLPPSTASGNSNGQPYPSASPNTLPAQAPKRRRTTDSGSPAAESSLGASTGSNGAPPGMARFDLPPIASTSSMGHHQPPQASFFNPGPPPPPTSFLTSTANSIASVPFSSVRDTPMPAPSASALAPPPPFCPLPSETSEEQVRRQMAQTAETKQAAGPFTTEKDQATHEEDVQHLFTMVSVSTWISSERRADPVRRFAAHR